MSGYSVCRIEEVPDIFGGKYPGMMRFLAPELATEQVAFTHRLMPPQSGGKGSYGHRHRTQEEVYYLISGRLEFKLDDDVMEVGPGTAVRVAPETVRSVWNEGPDDAELVIVSTRSDDLRAETEQVPDFWSA
jgi:mannose-6-phosphate isomerase-like protein (cupin superfamily)